MHIQPKTFNLVFVLVLTFGLLLFANPAMADGPGGAPQPVNVLNGNFDPVGDGLDTLQPQPGHPRRGVNLRGVPTSDINNTDNRDFPLNPTQRTAILMEVGGGFPAVGAENFGRFTGQGQAGVVPVDELDCAP